MNHDTGLVALHEQVDGAATLNRLSGAPAAEMESDDGDTAVAQAPLVPAEPLCVTAIDWPPTEMFAVRLVVPAFAAAEKLMVPLPVDDDGLCTVSQDAELTADHAQVDPVRRLILDVPPADGREAVAALNTMPQVDVKVNVLDGTLSPKPVGPIAATRAS